jgi:hypothetical protein
MMGPLKQKHCAGPKEAIDFIATLALDDDVFEYIQAPDGRHLTLEQLRAELPAAPPRA